jgi:hypothetical protein
MIDSEETTMHFEEEVTTVQGKFVFNLDQRMELSQIKSLYSEKR